MCVWTHCECYYSYLTPRFSRRDSLRKGRNEPVILFSMEEEKANSVFTAYVFQFLLNSSEFTQLVFTKNPLQAVNHVTCSQPSVATDSLFIILMENIQKKKNQQPCTCIEHVKTSVHYCR